MHSPTVEKLLPALAQAIAEMPDPKKNSANPAFRSKFADLGEVLDCAREPLARHGLLVTQTMANHVGQAVLVTTIWHAESGQFIASELPLVMDKPTAQGQGSAISYGRRYSLKALFGMVDVDDDGNAASNRPRPPEPAKAPEARSAPRSPTPATTTPPPKRSSTYEPFTLAEEAIAAIAQAKDDQRNVIVARMAGSKFSEGDLAFVRAAFTRRFPSKPKD